ncbi:MAG: hrpA, partial [Homoserinimonas sp.]|nr:hrpA [Homoserinimonas sp.]
TNLAAVILQMISLGLGDIANFPFLQPPDSRGIKDGLDLLRELAAISTTGEPTITKIGKQLSQLPIDPRLARMVIESKQHGTTREVMAIVAGLSIQDPRERPLEKRPQADTAHARFLDPTSDFLTLLNLWNYVKTQEKELSSGQFRRLCKAEYLNFLRIREWTDVYRQLERMAQPLGLTVGEASMNSVGIHRSLLAGLLSQLGIKDLATDKKQKNKQGDYIGARQIRFSIFPGSALARKQPAELMSAELVETSRLFARMNAAIDLSWAEPLAGDLAKRSYGEPHWEKKQGAVVAYERVTLYGVPIVARRRVQFSRVDPAYARELFIRHALVEADWDLDKLDRRLSEFERNNRKLRKELADVEERTRRRDILVDDEAVFEFYHRRIPADVYSQRSFETWWKKARATSPDLLTMTASDLLDEEATPQAEKPRGRFDDVETSFPKYWHQGDQRLTLSYRFEPGTEDDGVTAQVPIALLARLTPAGFDWQVPGLREELVTALIKSLPKAVRRNVVPAADWARKLLEGLPAEPDDLDQMALTEYLAAQIQRKTHTPVDSDDFDLERIPPHLKISFSVINEHGRQVARSKDLVGLQNKLRSRARESIAQVIVKTPNSLERDGLTSWDFDALPNTLDARQGTNTIRAYPALVDRGASVSIQLMSTPNDQARAMRAGLRRLVQLAVPSPTSYVQQHLTHTEKLTLAASPYQNTQALFEDCMVACIDAIIGDTPVWSRPDFERLRDEVSSRIMDDLFATVSLVARTIAAAREAEKAIKSASNIALLAPLADAREQLAALVFPGFVSRTGATQLRRLPLYLEGITHRVSKLGDNVGRDRVWMNEVQTARERYLNSSGKLPQAPDAAPHVVRARWLLEELRLSLFAQHLGTAEPVSLQRISRVLAGS